ncbi:molybdopterin synthase sulfur carrier subunit [Pantoea sp. 1.19]|uniref:molybdopterin synthase sulfur carrier subunit n=1 Tax=Pantoea sp. 1.19 TaxID=1925589 RepID=UPI0009489608|nr:molybdopterin synthase sulfur carrier subunit [Pantoea sp. 1.19]
MIRVLFFAQVRELTDTASLELAWQGITSVAALRDRLALRGERWALALSADNLLAAVNQTLVSFDHPLRDGDEVAFFPPVTGG